MGGSNGAVEAKSLVQVRDMLEAGPGNNPSHAMAYKIEYDFGWIKFVFDDKLVNLSSQSFSHLLDAVLSMDFVGFGCKYICERKCWVDTSFEHPHFSSRAEISMTDDNYHFGLVITVAHLVFHGT